MENSSRKAVLIISTLDTKGVETLYLRDKIASLGVNPLLMDISMRGKGESPADITPALVAEAGGSSLEEIHTSRERSQITEHSPSKGPLKLPATCFLERENWMG